MKELKGNEIFKTSKMDEKWKVRIAGGDFTWKQVRDEIGCIMIGGIKFDNKVELHKNHSGDDLYKILHYGIVVEEVDCVDKKVVENIRLKVNASKEDLSKLIYQLKVAEAWNKVDIKEYRKQELEDNEDIKTSMKAAKAALKKISK